MLRSDREFRPSMLNCIVHNNGADGHMTKLVRSLSARISQTLLVLYLSQCSERFKIEAQNSGLSLTRILRTAYFKGNLKVKNILLLIKTRNFQYLSRKSK